MLKRFHFALRPNGVLFLGKAEKLLSHNHPFEPIDGTRRFFRKVAGRPRNGSSTSTRAGSARSTT